MSSALVALSQFTDHANQVLVSGLFAGSCCLGAELFGFRHGACHPAVVKIGRKRHEALIREPVAETAEEAVEAPPRMKDQNRAPMIRFWCREIHCCFLTLG